MLLGSRPGLNDIRGWFIPSLATPSPNTHSHTFIRRSYQPMPTDPSHTRTQVWPDLFTVKFKTPGLHILTAHIRSIAPPRGFKEWGNLIWADFQKV